MKTLALAVVICIPFALLASAGEDAGVNAYTAHHDATPVPRCLMTGLGVKLCEADARDWCTAISSPVLEGRDTPDLRMEEEVPAESKDACEGVGW